MTSEILAALTRDSDGSVSVAFDRVYRTTPADLWDAVTTPERLERWYAPVVGDLRPGGTFVQKFDDLDAAECVVESCDAPSSFAFTWPVNGAQTLVTVTVGEADGGARLTLVHDRLTPVGAAGYGAGWQTYLDPYLTGYLAGELPTGWMATWERLHTSYRAEIAERGWGA